MTQEHLSPGKALKVHLLMKGRKAVWVNPYQLISAEVSSVLMFLGKSVLKKEANEREGTWRCGDGHFSSVGFAAKPETFFSTVKDFLYWR